MLNFISWKEFIIFLIIAVVIYYAYIFITEKLKSLRNPNRRWRADPPISHNRATHSKDLHMPENITSGHAAEPEPEEVGHDDEDDNQTEQQEANEQEQQKQEIKFKRLEKLADEIQDLILNQKDDVTKEDLQYKLKSHISIYSDLNSPPFRTAINNLIDRNVRDFDILLSIEELDNLWMPTEEEEEISTT